MKWIALLPAIALAAPAFAHKVVGVADGASLTLLVDQQPVKLRLANVDAPDKAQAFSEQSKRSLYELCFAKEATYTEQGMDNHGRIVAVVTCDGVEANRAQVERGMVWVYPKYNKDLTLPGLEAIAQKKRKGLWAEAEPVAPWEFRRPQIRRVSTRPNQSSPEGICFIDQRGEYRIVNGVKRYGC